MRPRNILGQQSIERIREDSPTIRHLEQMEEMVRERSHRFAPGELQLLKTMRRRYNEKRELSGEQRDKINRLWESVRTSAQKG